MKTEPVEAVEVQAQPALGLGGDGETIDHNRSISELISVLRTSFQKSYFDRVEEILIAREENLKRELQKKDEQHELTRESLGIERFQKAEAEEELKSFKARCAELENLRESIDAMRERVTMADERAKLAEERAEESEETYEKLLRKVKMAENQKSSDLVELKRKNGELESAKKGAEEELELWKREFGKLEERILKLEADTIKIITAENRAILIIGSDDDCAPGTTSSTKDDVLKRKRSSSMDVNEDDNVVPDKMMGQDQHLVVGGSSGNSDHATVTSATAGDPENQNIPANHGQGVSLEANGTPERRDFSYYAAKCLGV